MSLNINRRNFLQALIAAGASYVLPAEATKAQIDNLWTEAQFNPWYFAIDENGTLVEAAVAKPKIWEDIYYDIDTGVFTSPEDITMEVMGCEPLISYLNDQLDTEIENLEYILDSEPPEAMVERNELTKKVEALLMCRDAFDEEPWVDWVKLEGSAGCPKFQKLVHYWLSEPINWRQSEFFPVRAGAQGAALGFFQDQPYELLDKLGVVVVEGEHPGSTYYAAELRQDIEKANAAAQELGLPFRFKRENT
jgi:hypothetical protein